MKCKYLLPCGFCELKKKPCKPYKAEHAENIIAPLGTVKSVTIIKDDGTRKRIPLDKVIIERAEDKYGL